MKNAILHNSILRACDWLFAILAMSLTVTSPVSAGPFSPQAGVAGSDAIALNSALIAGWASGYSGYELPGSEGCARGTDLSVNFETPEKALGPAGNSNGLNEGTTFDIVSLGRGGCITLTFDLPIADLAGPDFAVFENGFFSVLPAFGFLELAWVEVSSDGVNFFRFDGVSLTPFPVGAFDNSIDASDIDGLAGKYIAGFGTPFDLSTLPDDVQLNKQSITHVRIIDVIGDGSELDNQTPANPIYDPYPTALSAGFDLDAVAVINQGTAVPKLQIPFPTYALGIMAMVLLLVRRFSEYHNR